MLRSIMALMLVTGDVAAAEPPVTALAFAPDGRSVLVASQAGVEVRSWPELKAGRKLTVQLSTVHDLAIAPDGKSLLVAGGTPGEAGVVELLDWPQAKSLRRWTVGDDVVQAVAWRSDGQQWGCACLDGTGRVFAADGKAVSVFKGHSRSVLAIVFLPDGKHVVSAGSDQSLRVWEAESAKAVRVMDNHTQAVTSLVLRPAQEKDALPTLASGGLDRTVRLWQPTIGRLVRFVRLPSPVLSVAWTADGKRLVAGCQDGQVRLLDPDALDILKTEKGFPGWVQSLAPVPNKPGEVLIGGPGLAIKTIRIE